MKTQQIEWYEACEIADVFTDTNNPEDDYAVSEEALADKWGISMDDFHEIMNLVFKHMTFSSSPLTNQPYVGLGCKHTWLFKKEVEQEFIHTLIGWLTEGEELPENHPGFMRAITLQGEVEFEITIKRPKKTTKSTAKPAF